MKNSQKVKTALSWSSGKDSAYALYQLQQDPNVEVVSLFSTINQAFERVAMHAVRVELLKKQVTAITPAVTLDIIELPFPCSNADYQRIMAMFCESLLNRGIEQVAFGDLFLQDVKAYRINNLQGTGLTPIFPLWGIDTLKLSNTLIKKGFKAITTCIDPKKLQPSFCGQLYDETFLTRLPKEVDACGENGEFHTFVYDAPIFTQPLDVKVGEIVTRDGFVFADILPI